MSGRTARVNTAAWGVGALSVALIALGSIHPLWLDEVLSLQWTRNAQNPWQILSLFRHDNNHPLNTLWIYLLGERRPDWTYRVLSAVSGATTLAMVWWAAGRLCPAARLAPLFLTGLSYPVVLYASEARGYAPAMALSLACFVVLLRWQKPTLWSIAAFWILSCAGLLAHATAVVPLGALGVWVVVREWPDWRGGIRRCVIVLGVPAAFFLWFAWYFLSKMMVAGGPDTTPVEVLQELFGFTFGLPASGPFGSVSMAAGASLLVAALVFGRFPVQGLRIFFGLLVLAALIPAALAAGPAYVHFRYAAVCIPFFFLLIGCLCERTPKNRAWVVVLAMALFAAGQTGRLAALALRGRGDPVGAAAWIAQASDTRAVVASNHDMLVGMVLEHYRRKLNLKEEFTYATRSAKLGTPPDWIIIAHMEWPPEHQSGTISTYDADYIRECTIFSAPVSGAHWTIYRRTNP